MLQPKLQLIKKNSRTSDCHEMLIYCPMPGVVAYSDFTVVHFKDKRGLYSMKHKNNGKVKAHLKPNYLISKCWIVIKNETVP